MRFKYGSFFGLTAVHTMFMSRAQIDNIFSVRDIKASALPLAESLLKEVCALKQVLSGKPLDGVNMPYVVLTPDYSSKYAEDLTNGLNLFLQEKERLQSEGVTDDLASLLGDHGASSDDLEALLGATKASASADTTAVFTGTGDNELDLDTLVDEKDTSGGLDINFLFDAPELPDYVSPIEDLVAYGASGEYCLMPKIKTPRNLRRFILQNGKLFTPDEKQAVMEQIAKIPTVPTGCNLPTDVFGQGTVLSKTSLQFLQILSGKAQETICENVSRIDYVIQKLGMLLYKSVGEGRALFFAPKDKFSGGDFSWVGYNNFLQHLCAQYLTDDSRQSTISNVNYLLRDCDTVLGISSPEENEEYTHLQVVRAFLNGSGEATQEQAAESLLSLADSRSMTMSDRDVLKAFVYRLLALPQQLQLLVDGTKSLKYVLTLYTVMNKVISQSMYSALDLGQYMPEGSSVTCENIQQACANLFLNFTKETGICGLYSQYTDMFQDTLSAVGAPLLDDMTNIFPEQSSRRVLIKMLRKHLLSLRSRIGG